MQSLICGLNRSVTAQDARRFHPFFTDWRPVPLSINRVCKNPVNFFCLSFAGMVDGRFLKSHRKLLCNSYEIKNAPRRIALRQSSNLLLKQPAAGGES